MFELFWVEDVPTATFSCFVSHIYLQHVESSWSRHPALSYRNYLVFSTHSWKDAVGFACEGDSSAQKKGAVNLERELNKI